MWGVVWTCGKMNGSLFSKHCCFYLKQNIMQSCHILFCIGSSVASSTFAKIFRPNRSPKTRPMLNLRILELNIFIIIILIGSSCIYNHGRRRTSNVGGGCKPSVNFLIELPIVLSENLPEWNGFLPSLRELQPPLPPPRILMFITTSFLAISWHFYRYRTSNQFS